MNILFVIHSCDPKINDNAYVPISLGDMGHNILVISSRYAKSLKGEVLSKYREVHGNTEFYRPFKKWTDFRKKPNSCWPEIERKLDIFLPDVIVCYGEFNYKLAVKISKKYNVDMHLYVEYLRPDKFAPPIRGVTFLRRRIPLIYEAISHVFIRYLSKHVKSLMYAYYGDAKYENRYNKYGLSTNQVHWCTELSQYELSKKRDLNTGVYIGSLEEFKNSGKLCEIIPIILEKTRIEKFVVIGPGPYARNIMSLVNKYPEKLIYRESVPRSEAIKIISSAGFSFTPVSDCGLGFIGDSWGCGTPLIVMYDLDGFLSAGVDVIKISSLNEIIGVIDVQLNDHVAWKRLSDEGKGKYNSIFSSFSISHRIMQIITNT